MSSSEDDDAAFDAFLASLKPPKKDKYRVSSGSLDGFIVDDSYVSFEDSSFDEDEEERKGDKKGKFQNRKGRKIYKSYIDETDELPSIEDSNNNEQREHDSYRSTKCDLAGGAGRIHSTRDTVGLVDYGNEINEENRTKSSSRGGARSPLHSTTPPPSRKLVLSSIKRNWNKKKKFTPKRSTANPNSVSSRGAFSTPRIIFSSDSDDDSAGDIKDRNDSTEENCIGNKEHPPISVPSQEFEKVLEDRNGTGANCRKTQHYCNDSIENLCSDFDQVDLDWKKTSIGVIKSKPATSTASPFSAKKKQSKILIFSDDSESDDDVIFVESDSDKENSSRNTSSHGPSSSSMDNDSVFLTPTLIRKKIQPKPTHTKSENSTLNRDLSSEADSDNICLSPTLVKKKATLKPFQTLSLGTRTSHFKTPGPQKNMLIRKDGLPPNLPRSCENGTGFKRHRDALTKSLYEHFNKTVFEGKLPKDMIVEWDKRLLKTAGMTKCSTRTTTTSNLGISCIDKVYSAKICLSDKVLDSLHRLRDTLCHEMCHAAVWLVDRQNDGHGPFWRRWAQKAMASHPDMPMVKRCHSYDISYKFHYQCTMCRKVYGRHSKSIKLDKQVCGVCKGRLVLLPPKKLDGTPIKTRTPNKFAMFVKENYKVTQKSNSVGGVTPKHSDVMKALSKQFASLSARK